MFLIQHRHYTFDVVILKKKIKNLFNNCYKTPFDIELYKELEGYSQYPFDELFIWSLLIYDGYTDDSLIFYYWSLCSNPMACLLAALIILTRLKESNYLPDELKAKISILYK